MTRTQHTAAQDRRREALAKLRLQRPLTEAELAEEAMLERRLAHRVWRQQQREASAALKAKINAMPCLPSIQDYTR